MIGAAFKYLLVSAAFLGGLAGIAAAASGPVAKADLGTVLADAHRLAASTGGKVVRVAGGSMLPYFGDGSVLVLRAATPETLRAGMIAVYRNRFGELVAHRAERRDEAGAWVMRGANNASEDSTRVTAENLLGVVYVTLHSDARGAEVSGATAALTGADAAPLALAAPAR
jgi:signal peptidase I